MSLCFKAYLKMDSNTGRDLKADVLQRGLITGCAVQEYNTRGETRLVQKDWTGLKESLHRHATAACDRNVHEK